MLSHHHFFILSLNHQHTPLQIATCDYHTAMLTFNGHLYTCGAKENGKLGHGSQGSSGNLGRITRVTKFLDSDEQTDMDVRIGYVRTQIFSFCNFFSSLNLKF